MCMNAFAEGSGSVGVHFSEDAIGALGDYQKLLRDTYEFEVDAQAQRAVNTSLAAHVSIQRDLGGKLSAIHIKPFASYNRDDVGNTLDAGGLLNFSIGAFDIAGGASFRGANPTAAALEKRFDADDVEVEVHAAGYSPSVYTLPAENNVNAVLNAGFNWKRIETSLTGYVPITKRDIVPIVVISRSQTSIGFGDGWELAVVVDARTYLHADGAEVSFKPLGAITYKF